jgi:alginate production protein
MPTPRPSTCFAALILILSFCIALVAQAEDDPGEHLADDLAEELEEEDEADEEGAKPSFLDHLEVGGHIEVSYERLRNFDLDASGGDDLDLLPIEIELGVLFEPNDHFLAYLQLLYLHQFSLGPRGDEVEGSQLLVEEAYMTLAEPDLGLALQVGRQNFEDVRQWLYDADLDGLRGRYERGPLLLELAATREALVQQDVLNTTDSESIDNYPAFGSYAVDGNQIVAGYGILLDDRDSGDRPVFLGVQSFGGLGDLTWWADAAILRGEAEDRDLRGFGFDLLGTWRFAAPLSPYLTLGYAFGSGDGDEESNHDNGFRQTGLQGNETEIGGLTPIQYYGEAFDPELSNLKVLTTGIGIHPLPGISVDLLYHRYWQDEAAGELRDAAIDAEPNGESTDLGSEIDLVLGYEEIEDLRVRGYLGYFMPGKAFGKGADDALFFRLEVQYEF